MSELSVIWNTQKSEQHTGLYGEYYESKIFHVFGFAWYFKLYRDELEKSKKTGNALLNCFLVELPPNVSRVSIKRTDFIAETNTKYNTSILKFEKDYMNWSWPDGVSTTKALKPFKNLTMTHKFQLVSVYDDAGKSIANQFLNSDDQKMSVPINSNKLQEYDVRLDSLATQVDKLMKDFNQMQNVLKDIKLQMNEEKKK
eukprot:508261_1